MPLTGKMDISIEPIVGEGKGHASQHQSSEEENPFKEIKEQSQRDCL